MSRRARVGVLIAVIAATGVAIARSDPRAIGHALAGMSWGWAAIACVINLFGVLIDAMRLRIIAGAARDVGWRQVVRAQFVGIVGNVLFPFKLGEGARAYMLTRDRQMTSANALKVVFADRVIDAVVLPIFIVAASLIMPLPPNVLRYRGWLMATVVATIIAILAIGRHRVRLAGAVAASLVSWTARAAIVWCMLIASHLTLPLSATITTLVIVNLGIAIAATPGNVGSFELAAAAALALWKVPSDTAFSVAIATHVVEVVPPVLIGLMIGGVSLVTSS